MYWVSQWNDLNDKVGATREVDTIMENKFIENKYGAFFFF